MPVASLECPLPDGKFGSSTQSELRMDLEGLLPLTIYSTITLALDLVVSCIVKPILSATYRAPLFTVEDSRLVPRIPSYPFLICNMQMTKYLSHGEWERSILLLSISAVLTLASFDQMQLRAFACSFFLLDLSSSLKSSEHQAHPCSHYGCENK
jgi:hypothetical protein